MVAHILLIEDNPGDRALARLALEEIGTPVELLEAEDGVEALEQLRRISVGGQPPPHLVLLDLNLPRATGFQVLQYLRHSPSLAGLPVVVLTSSNAETDRAGAAALGATAYLTKPETFGEYLERIRQALRFAVSSPAAEAPESGSC